MKAALGQPVMQYRAGTDSERELKCKATRQEKAKHEDSLELFHWKTYLEYSCHRHGDHPDALDNAIGPIRHDATDEIAVR